jgi:putative hydrolase of the HAD superfamily
MPVETIFLDAGGVLVWPNWQRISVALLRHGVKVDPAMLGRADPHARRALDLSDVISGSSDQRRGSMYFNLVLTHAGVPLSERTEDALSEMREYHARFNLWELVPDFVPQALGRLRADGFRLGVVSNANGTLHEAFDRLGLAPFFEVIIDSADEGVEKPHPRLFEVALERAGATPATTVHVGDLYHVDVVGARAAGLSAILVDEADLRHGVDCPRVRSIAELLTNGRRSNRLA